MSSRTGQVANGKGKEGGEAMNEAGYQTLIVKFSEPITALDGIFDDAEAWGVDTLKGWIDSYESSRFTAIDSHTAVITSEYNMECLKEWLGIVNISSSISQYIPSCVSMSFVLLSNVFLLNVLR